MQTARPAEYRHACAAAMIRLALGCGLLALASMSIAQESNGEAADLTKFRHALEDMRFTGPWLIDGEKTGPDDVFVFEDGMFVSKDCLKWGYSPAPYWVRQDADGIHFQVELQSPDHGTLEYEGVFDGNTLRATVMWTKKRWYWSVEQEHQVIAQPIEPVD